MRPRMKRSSHLDFATRSDLDLLVWSISYALVKRPQIGSDLLRQSPEGSHALAASTAGRDRISRSTLPVINCETA